MSIAEIAEILLAAKGIKLVLLERSETCRPETFDVEQSPVRRKSDHHRYRQSQRRLEINRLAGTEQQSFGAPLDC